MSSVRNIRKTVRLNPSEEQLLIDYGARNNSMEISAVLREGGVRLALSELDDEAFRERGLIWVGADNDGARDRAHQLRQMGGNLNQLTRSINTVTRILDDARLDGTLTEETAERVKRLLPSQSDVDECLASMREIIEVEEAWIEMLRERLHGGIAT